jgi:hypothetical protein
MSDKTQNGGPDRYPRDREKILCLPHKQRIPYLETIYISSPRGDEILSTIEACYERVSDAQQVGIKCDSRHANC